MSISGLLARFTGLYLLFAVIAGTIIKYLKINSSIAFGIIVLWAAAMLTIESFAKKNGRYFDKKEKNLCFVGMVLISLVFQALVLATTDTVAKMSAGGVVFALGLTALIHAAIISVSIDMIRKNLVKRGIINNDPETGVQRKFSKNPFLNSLIKLTLITIVLIVVAIISIPIVGHFAK